VTHQAKALLAVLTDPALVDVGKPAIVDQMRARRDRRESRPLSAVGLVICEDDGRGSGIIRMTVQDALLIALVAIGNHVADSNKHTAVRDEKTPAG
jgi:hypothetical protein